MDGAQIQAISSPTVNPAESGSDPPSSAQQPICSPHVAMNGRGPREIVELTVEATSLLCND